ncbi:unnamed protein product [Rhizophagus irregularis]|nr:unnamed protein product [Rhizophagus irregularis]
MDEVKLSDDVFEQIKDIEYDKLRGLTEEQESLIDKLILNEELKSRYKENGTTVDLLEEVKSNIIIDDDGWLAGCFEPKNADNDETESLESLRIGFTKLDVNSKDESN